MPPVLLGIPWAALRGPLRNQFRKKRRPQPYWGGDNSGNALEASNALNYRIWGIPAVLSRGIPGNALRAFPGSFRIFSGISSGKSQPYWGCGPKEFAPRLFGLKKAIWQFAGFRCQTGQKSFKQTKTGFLREILALIARGISGESRGNLGGISGESRGISGNLGESRGNSEETRGNPGNLGQTRGNSGGTRTKLGETRGELGRNLEKLKGTLQEFLLENRMRENPKSGIFFKWAISLQNGPLLKLNFPKVLESSIFCLVCPFGT